MATKDLPIPGTEFVPPRLNQESCEIVRSALILFKQAQLRQVAKYALGSKVRVALEEEVAQTSSVLSFFGG